MFVELYKGGFVNPKSVSRITAGVASPALVTTTRTLLGFNFKWTVKKTVYWTRVFYLDGSADNWSFETEAASLNKAQELKKVLDA